jgi:PAS domain S-box-containing protein
MLATTQPQDYVDTALDALRNDSDWRSALDRLPVPAYLTDANGAVTYWNRACIHFAGREPELGRDKWCVTWKLYSMTGERLPHDECPMAEAIRERKPVRGKVAVALRPDGSRRAFAAYPTPLFRSDGELEGAVNLLIDVTDQQAGALGDQAARCRRLARSTHDRGASEILVNMAKGYDATAALLREE